jgi:uncharacterized damage-inducible protein DinB
MKTKSKTRQDVLIDMNLRWLRQALALLPQLDDAAYTTSPRGFQPHRVGAHLRHIIEFYQCFLNGIANSHIDYDARRRDESIERSRKAAASAIENIIASLRTDRLVRENCIVWARMEDAGALEVTDAYMESSVSRELQVLSSHTIHHFALIAMTLRMHGVDLDPEFGMAPSTLRYLAGREAA